MLRQIADKSALRNQPLKLMLRMTQRINIATRLNLFHHVSRKESTLNQMAPPNAPASAPHRIAASTLEHRFVQPHAKAGRIRRRDVSVAHSWLAQPDLVPLRVEHA